MDDTDLLASFRADVPERPVSSETTQRFRAAVHQAERRAPLPLVPRLPLRPRPTLLASLAADSAAALVLGLVTAHAGGTPPAASPSQAPLTVRLVADRAAAAALGQPAVQPGQLVYRLIRYKLNGFPIQRPDGTETTWTTADGTVEDATGGGPFIRLPLLPAPPYADLGSLPSGPAALERYLADQSVPGSGDSDGDQRARHEGRRPVPNGLTNPKVKPLLPAQPT